MLLSSIKESGILELQIRGTTEAHVKENRILPNLISKRIWMVVRNPLARTRALISGN
jgi:hypothetical protein